MLLDGLQGPERLGSLLIQFLLFLCCQFQGILTVEFCPASLACGNTGISCGNAELAAQFSFFFAFLLGVDSGDRKGVKLFVPSYAAGYGRNHGGQRVAYSNSGIPYSQSIAYRKAIHLHGISYDETV